MIQNELKKFIKKQDLRLRQQYKADEDKHILLRTVKLTEELGELCDEVLSFNAMQRKDKLAKHEMGNLAAEFADVLIVTLLLAEAMNVNIEKALREKIIEIDKRYKK